jgi:hypothetical protein
MNKVLMGNIKKILNKIVKGKLMHFDLEKLSWGK